MKFDLPTTLQWTIRISLFISGISMAYILFVYGHTEVVSHTQVLIVATIAGLSALVGGTLMWVGLPTEPETPGKKGKKKAH